MELEKILEKMLKTGSSKEQLLEVKKRVEKIDGSRDILDSITRLISDIKEKSYEFLNSEHEGINNINALSTCIYLPDINNSVKIKILGGKDNDNNDITDTTMFDVASITKLFTLVLTFKLAELHVINLNDKVVDILPEYSGLEDFTINDLLLLCGELYTNGNVALAPTKENAEEILKTVYLKSNDRTINKYTDFGSIIIGKIIEKSIQNAVPLSYDEIMYNFVLRDYGLNHTKFNPTNESITGNSGLNSVHDPKARVLGGVTGSAGIFTTSDDLASLAKNMFLIDNINYSKLRNMISKENVEKIGTITFPDSPLSNKGLLGMYQKSNDPDKYFVNSVFAKNTFSAQGWTGSLSTFDSKNKMHLSILVDAIKADLPPELLKNNKLISFSEEFRKYLNEVSLTTATIYVLKQMLNKKFEYEIDVNQVLR